MHNAPPDSYYDDPTDTLDPCDSAARPRFSELRAAPDVSMCSEEPDYDEETLVRSRYNGLGQHVQLKQQGNAYRTYVDGAQQGVSVYFRYALETFNSHADKDSDGY
jgi:hypothetical protein